MLVFLVAAGLLIAETEFRHQVKIDIEPFKGLMLGLFFLSAGMGIDWRIVLDDPLLIIASALGLIALKIVIIFGLCLALRPPRARAANVAITLGQAGEFGFLVIGLSVAVGLLEGDVAQFMLIVVGLIMLLTPGLDALANVAERRLESGEEDDAFEETAWSSEVGGHVIIAGYGRVGKTIASILDRQDIRYVAVDSDPELVRAASRDGRPVRLGNAARLDVLEHAGLATAAALVVTIGDTQAVEGLTHAIRRLAPALPILARARDDAHADRLLEGGANVAVPETTEGSLRLAEMLLMEYGTDEELAIRQVDQLRGLERV
ncbi:MAG: NAD-binding protein [Pseudomonadota bacterium]